jgi:hypothetical protein
LLGHQAQASFKGLAVHKEQLTLLFKIWGRFTQDGGGGGGGGAIHWVNSGPPHFPIGEHLPLTKVLIGGTAEAFCGHQLQARRSGLETQVEQLSVLFKALAKVVQLVGGGGGVGGIHWWNSTPPHVLMALHVPWTKVKPGGWTEMFWTHHPQARPRVLKRQLEQLLLPKGGEVTLTQVGGGLTGGSVVGGVLTLQTYISFGPQLESLTGTQDPWIKERFPGAVTFWGHHPHWSFNELPRQVVQLRVVLRIDAMVIHVGGGGGGGGATHWRNSGPPHCPRGAHLPFTKVVPGGCAEAFCGHQLQERRSGFKIQFVQLMVLFKAWAKVEQLGGGGGGVGGIHWWNSTPPHVLIGLHVPWTKVKAGGITETFWTHHPQARPRVLKTQLEQLLLPKGGCVVLTQVGGGEVGGGVEVGAFVGGDVGGGVQQVEAFEPGGRLLHWQTPILSLQIPFPQQSRGQGIILRTQSHPTR